MSEFDEPPETMSAVQRLVIASLHLRRAVMRRTGLTVTEFEALEFMVETPSAPSELARLLDVSTAAATGVVDRLERRGHVERRPHPQDRRRTEVHITDSGRDEMAVHLRPMLLALRALDEGLTEAERQVVLRFLSGAAAAFDEVGHGAAAPR